MSNTQNLLLPFIAAGQSQKHVTHNEALLLLDKLSQISVISRTVSTPPATPNEGDLYIIPINSTALWANKTTQLALFRGNAWAYIPAKEGFIAYVQAEDKPILYNSTSWVDLPVTLPSHSHDILQNMALLGIGTTADANNPLSIKVNNVLVTAKPVAETGTGDMRYTLNKESTAKMLSLLLQSNWSGRAELGLLGSDNLTLRVSEDGTTWNDVFNVDKVTGAIDIIKGTQKTQLDIYTANGTYTKPVWAKRILAILVGAGSGGGGGRRGAASTVRYGGGGGAAGGVSKAEWLANEVANTLTITIAQGGAGGTAATTDSTDGGNGGLPPTTSIANAGASILIAFGGNSSSTIVNGGTATSGAAHTGGLGLIRSNGGGVATLVTSSTNNGYSTICAESAGGGGAGGSLTTANILTNSGNGGNGYFIGSLSRQSVGALAGASGMGGNNGANKAWSRGMGSGGGGGGAGDISGTASGGNGGNGGVPGGGGGGGGASTNGANSGAGGNGGRGEVWLITIG